MALLVGNLLDGLSQWNPCRSRGARASISRHVLITRCLSGTPAEAGVRVERFSTLGTQVLVSVEPLPKQGCEKARKSPQARRGKVSVEPLPKQGCELNKPANSASLADSLSGTPAEAGVRDNICWTDRYGTVVSVEPLPKQGCEGCCLRLVSRARRSLSGTPAEAGVRGEYRRKCHRCRPVSVEPLPKQGCEWKR